MSLSLLTNVASLIAQNNIGRAQTALQRSVQRLSSGLRINSASDDPAGLAISSRLSAQVLGMQQAGRNAQDLLSMVQTADAGLADVGSLLSRMRELAVESANGGTLTSSDRAALNTEYSALQAEINRIVGVTAYNGQNLIDGTLSSGTSFQVGAFNSASNRIGFSLNSSDANTLGINSGQSDVGTQGTAQNAIDLVSTAINSVANLRAGTGAMQSRLGVTTDYLAATATNLAAARAAIADTDAAAETASLARSTILVQAGIAVLAQANQQSSLILRLLET